MDMSACVLSACTRYAVSPYTRATKALSRDPSAIAGTCAVQRKSANDAVGHASCFYTAAMSENTPKFRPAHELATDIVVLLTKRDILLAKRAGVGGPRKVHECIGNGQRELDKIQFPNLDVKRAACKRLQALYKLARA